MVCYACVFHSPLDLYRNCEGQGVGHYVQADGSSDRRNKTLMKHHFQTAHCSHINKQASGITRIKTMNVSELCMKD